MRLIHVQTTGPRLHSGRVLRPVKELERCPKTGKRSYASEDDALVAAYTFATNNQFGFSSRSAYFCQHCQNYHLTGNTR